MRRNPKIEFLSLKIKNFGPYKDEHEIDFSVDPVKNVTLVKGEQGGGKSSIFQMLWWLLFPEFIEENKLTELKFLRSNKLIDAVNQVKIRETAINEIIETGGSIKFIKYDHSGNSVEYEIKRTFKFKKTGEEIKLIDKSINKSEEFLVYKDNAIEKNHKRVYNLVINEFYPKYVRDFVFIFGEGLERILSIENVSKIKDDAVNISDKPRITALSDYLDEVQKNFRNKRKFTDKKNENLKVKLEEIDNIQAKIEKTSESLKLEKEKLEDIKFQLDKDENEFKKIGKNIEYVEKLIQINKQKNELNKEKLRIIKRRESLLLKYLPFIYLNDAITKIKNDINKKREDNKYPIPITQDVLNHILTMNKCVCGNEFTNNMIQQINKLKSNLQSYEYSESMIKFEQKLDDTCYQLLNYKKEIYDLEDELSEKNGKISDLDTEKRLYESNLSTEEKQEEWYERVKGLETAIKEGNKEIGKKTHSISILTGQLNEFEEELKKEEEQYKKLKSEFEKKNEKHDYTDYIDRVNKIKVIVTELEMNISEKIRNETQIEILKALKLIAKDPENWKMVYIEDSKTDISDKKEDGWLVYAETKTDSKIKNMSTGQTNILGISFIYALSSILNIDLPLIIDSPFVNIDDETRDAMVENLPSIYKGRQLIFFMKQMELYGPRSKKDNKITDLYPKLKTKIGVEWNIANPNNDNAKLTRS